MHFHEAITILKATQAADPFVAEHNGLQGFIFVSSLIVMGTRNVREGRVAASRVVKVVDAAGRAKFGKSYFVSDAYDDALASPMEAPQVVAEAATEAFRELLAMAKAEA